MFDGVCFTYTLKIYMLVTVVFWTNFSILTFNLYFNSAAC